MIGLQNLPKQRPSGRERSRQLRANRPLLEAREPRRLRAGKAFAQLAMPPAQKPAGAEGAEGALPRDQPATADAAAPTPANNGSAGAAGAEVNTRDLSQDPSGNNDLLGRNSQTKAENIHRGRR